MKQIKISKELSLPLDIVTQTVAILAKRRVGKSYTMRGIAEQLLENDQQVVLIDPKGDQWGIRSSADGKKPGYGIVILGGEHGDAPLEVNSGEVVAKLVVEERVSVLLDLSTFRKHEIATFMAIFLENLYRLKAQEKYRTPVMLIVDEADAIAPQRPQKGEERMLGAIEDIVRRGGQRGIGCILVTQRSAVLNKNVLTQAQMLIVLRTIAPQDLAAMNAWIDVHGTTEERKTLMESLPALPVGDAWFWSPGWPTADGIFKLVHVLPIKTFDSAATPKPGERKITPKNLADVDLDALKKQMAATIEKAKENDPKLLKARIAQLEKERDQERKNPLIKSVPDQYAIQQAVKEAEKRKDIEFMAEKDEWLKHMNTMFEIIKKAGDMLKEIKLPDLKVRKQKTEEYKKILTPEPKETYMDAKPFHPRNGIHVGATYSTDGLGKGEKIVLQAIAQYPDGITEEHIAVLTGYKSTSRYEYLRKLTARGMIERKGSEIYATQSGIDALGNDFNPLPTGSELREHLMQTLPEGEKKVLRVLIEAYPHAVSSTRIEEETGYKSTSRYEYIRKLKARKLVEETPDGIKTTDKLW